MTIRIDLPGDNWAEVRTADEMTPRHRRPLDAVVAQLDDEFITKLQAAADDETEIKALGLTAHQAELAFTMQDAAIISAVDSWSFGSAPSTESVQDLPQAAYDALSAAVSGLIKGLVVPDAGPTAEVDPANPTGR